MKKGFLFLFVIAGFCLSGFSQENENVKKERIKLYPSSHETSKTMTIEEEIAQCEAHIEALDQKEEIIRQSPEETKIATETGWFIQAEETRKKLRARIQKLKSQEK